MAVDSATMSTASGILKNNYEGQIIDQVNNPNALFAEVDKNSKDIVEGAQVVFNVRMNPSQAIGNRADLGTLPAAQRTRNLQPTFNLKYMYGVMRITGPLMEASRTDAGAFIRALRNEVEGMTIGMKLDLNRQLYGSSSNDGRICACGVTTSSLTVQLATGTNMLHFEEGMLIDLLNSGSSYAAISNGTAREILSVDEDNLQLTIDTAGGSVTTDSTTIVYRASNRNNEINGLEAIIDSSSSLQGVDPTTAGNRRWKSYVDANFGGFTLTKLQGAVDKIHNRSGEWINRIYSQETPRNLYLATLIAERRIVSQGDDKKLNGGFTGLSYTGGATEAIWVKDPYAPSASTVYLVNLARLELRRSKDFEFIELNGSKWIPDILGSSAVDAYKAVMATYHQLMTTKRNAHGKLQLVTA
jgi:hypothetical protein